MDLQGQIKKQLFREIKILKHSKGFLMAGFPRFARLFGRDSLISSWQLLDWDSEICRATLENLSKLQGKTINNEKEEEPGKIIHETDFERSRHPKSYFPFPYYGSIDSTPLYLILFSFYFKKTKDKKFLKSHWKNILLALNWMEKYGDKDKDYFLEYQRKNPKAVFHQGWKDGFKDHLKIKPPVAIVEAQGYQYLALKEIAKIAKIKNDLALAKKLIKKAQILKKEFNKKFWMQDKKYFCLALDTKKQQRKAITSNPGHLLFCGIVDKNKIKPTVRRLFQKDLWTKYGIRTHSVLEPDFDARSYHLGSVWPHDNWIIAQGLKKLGYKKEYQKIKTAVFRAVKEFGSFPEYYGVVDGKVTLEMKKTPCDPQAWTAGALLNFLLTG